MRYRYRYKLILLLNIFWEIELAEAAQMKLPGVSKLQHRLMAYKEVLTPFHDKITAKITEDHSSQ